MINSRNLIYTNILDLTRSKINKIIKRCFSSLKSLFYVLGQLRIGDLD